MITGLLFIWFFHFQELKSRPSYGPVLVFGFEGIPGVIEEAILRTISHIDKEHLYGNLRSISFPLIIIFLFQKRLVAVGNVLFSFTFGALISYNYSIVGFSGVAAALTSIALMVLFLLLIQVGKEEALDLKTAPIITLLIILLLQHSKLFIAEVVSVIWFESLMVASFHIQKMYDVHPNYGTGSTEVHVLGSLTGVLVFIMVLTLIQLND